MDGWNADFHDGKDKEDEASALTRLTCVQVLLYSFASWRLCEKYFVAFGDSKARLHEKSQRR